MVQSKRHSLTRFLSIVPKKFADEFRRDDVLTFRNKPMQEYEPKSVDTMMMCVVTFFNRWLKIKFGIEKSDWPDSCENAPNPTPMARFAAGLSAYLWPVWEMDSGLGVQAKHGMKDGIVAGVSPMDGSDCLIRYRSVRSRKYQSSEFDPASQSRGTLGSECSTK